MSDTRLERARVRRAFRLLRVAQDLTQEEVGALAGLPAGRYWRIENLAEPYDDSTRDALARVFGCAASALPGKRRPAAAPRRYAAAV